ncbi:MAG: hypothetical protein PHD13_06430 [Methanocellales archaeon]|nr:hypothetical protein [Methanocellales archaeon]MDD3291895.1 hypothetical protein [Methanocellales archaeon]MDD5235794.1 hypothetical protein [Methanocellales archaeon]MDD5485551.1 hypothetical protein [Methanocellales archaeon]
MLEGKRIKKTKKMLEIERKIGEPIEVFLRREYIDNKKSAIKMGAILGVGSSTIRNWLKEAGIKRRGLSEARFAHFDKEVEKPSDEQLRKWYVDEKKSTPEIGKILGVNGSTIVDWLKEAGIKRRDQRDARFLSVGKEIIKPSNDQLRRWYIDEGKSTYEIGKDLGVNWATALNWLKEAGIPIRHDYYEMHGYDFEKPSTDQLRKWYVADKKSTMEVAEIVGVSFGTVSNWLKEANIPIRDQSEAKFVQYGKEIQKPADELLRRWYIDERESTYEIAEIIGVSRSTVSHWLEGAGVQRRDDREQVFAYYGKEVEKPSDEQLRKWYVDEKKSSTEIAEIIGVSHNAILRWLDRAEISRREVLYGYKEWLQCADGHEVRSGYERRVDDWLYFNGVAHDYNEELPGDRKYKCDFKVEDWYIEVWGLIGIGSYDEKTERKINYYEKHGLKRIDIFHYDFDTNDWMKKLEPLLEFSNPEERVQRFLKDFDPINK